MPDKPVVPVKQGNFGFSLTFNIQNADGTVYDLTGKVVVLKVWTHAGASKYTRTGTLVDAPNGKCSFTTSSTDFDTIGDFDAEIEIQSNPAGTYVEDTVTFIIRVGKTSP